VEIHQIIFFTLMFAACCYAGLRGGAPERITALAMVCALGASLALTVFRTGPVGIYSTVEIGVALTDLSLFLVITAIALFSSRFWPIPMASMIGCGLFGHLTKPLGPDILTRAYYIAVAVWAYPELVLLIVATWRHQRRLQRYGKDYAWVWQLPSRYRNGWSVDELARPLSQN
jgi:hypothetical protein